MTDVHDVITNLETLKDEIRTGKVKSASASYAVRRMDWLEEAVALLEAQEPRVMTMEELVSWQKQPSMARDPIYVEYRDGKGFGAPHWAMDNFGFNVASCRDNYRAGVYGILLRCWTSRPDDKRRAETPWE